MWSLIQGPFFWKCSMQKAQHLSRSKKQKPVLIYKVVNKCWCALFLEIICCNMGVLNWYFNQYFLDRRCRKNRANLPHCCCMYVLQCVSSRVPSLIRSLCLCDRLWSCVAQSFRVAAVVAAVVSAVESVNHQRMMRTTSMWTQKTWRHRSKQSRMEEVSLDLTSSSLV